MLHITGSSVPPLLSLLLLGFSLQVQLQVQALVTEPEIDSSYTEVVYNSTEMPLEDDREYDYIVVGGGTVGCPLAATLSERHSVLVLERGNAPQAYPFLSRASDQQWILTREDPILNVEFTSEEGVEIQALSILGGSSMVFFDSYLRAPGEFFASSSVAWDMGSVEKAYEWVEETPYLVSSPAKPTIWQSAVRDASLEAGIVPDNGFTLDYKNGTSVMGMLYDEFGRRHGAAELLNRGHFGNLRVVTRATAQRVIFSSGESNEEEGPKAIGVEYTDSKGNSHRAFVRAGGEVILCASAFGSTKLLMLSGIGPEPYLSSMRIPLVYPQPNVGKFMFDNPRIAAFVIPPFPQEFSGVQVAGITKDYVIESWSEVLLSSPNPLPFTYFPRNASSVNLTLAVINGMLAQPFSRGTLRLGSRDNASSEEPRVRFNYFSDPKDLSHCIVAARKISEILNTTSMERFEYEDPEGNRGFTFFGADFPSHLSEDSEFEKYCREMFVTSWTYYGGCGVGKVVDGEFRVMGTKALRVVDASTFVSLPGVEPLATKMMLGRYVGQKMLQERKEPYY